MCNLAEGRDGQEAGQGRQEPEGRPVLGHGHLAGGRPLASHGQEVRRGRGRLDGRAVV